MQSLNTSPTASSSVTCAGQNSVTPKDTYIHPIGVAAGTHFAGLALRFPDRSIELTTHDLSPTRVGPRDLKIGLADKGSPVMHVSYSAQAQLGEARQFQRGQGQIIERHGISFLPFGVTRLLLQDVAGKLMKSQNAAEAVATFTNEAGRQRSLAECLKSIASQELTSSVFPGRALHQIGVMAPTPHEDMSCLFPDGSLAVVSIPSKRKIFDGVTVTTISTGSEVRNFFLKFSSPLNTSAALLFKAVHDVAKSHGRVEGIEGRLLERLDPKAAK